MAKYSLISVKGSVENIRNLVQQAFESSGFVVRWENQTKGRAEKGSMGANIALGVGTASCGRLRHNVRS